MSTRAEIWEKLQSLNKQSIQCLVATFVSYEKATASITVQLPNGLKIPGVRLKAAVNKTTAYYSIMVPREKSTVLIGQVGSTAEAGEYYLVMCDEFETVTLKADKVIVTIDKTGVMMQSGNAAKFKMKANGRYYIANDSYNLHTLMGELIDEIKAIKILVAGSAGPYPLTVTTAQVSSPSSLKFETVWAKLGNLLTDQE
jgi:hypothetical protein